MLTDIELIVITPDNLATLLAGYDPGAAPGVAATPPSGWYFDVTFARREAASVFARSWQTVARLEQLDESGAYVCAQVADEPLVIVRGGDRVRGFYNVCRHHAAPVAAGPAGRVSALHCPYHGWTYELDGALRSAPHFEGAVDFDRGDHGLREVRIGTWANWVFACLDAQAPSLDGWLEGVTQRLGPDPLPTLGFHERVSYTLECNWKVYVDNYLDGGYHVPYLHRELNDALDVRDYRIETGLRHSLQTCPTSSCESTASAVRGGAPAHYLWIYPNLMINWYAGVMDVNLVLPLGPERCVVHFDYYFAGQPAAFRAQSIEVADRVQREDVAICEAVQRGLRSRSYESGRLSPSREGGAQLFHQLLHGDLSS